MVFVLSILYHIPLPVSCIKCEETPYFRAFAGFSSMSLRMSFFIFLSSVSVARSLADEHTREVTFPILCSVVVTGVWFCVKENPPFFRKHIIQSMNSSKSTIQENKGFNRTVISITSWEFHPGMVLMQPYPLPATLLTLGLWL